MQKGRLNKLPIGDILLEAIKLPITHARTCVKLAIPLLISSVLLAISVHLEPFLFSQHYGSQVLY
jgi:hypothetical protein